MKRSTKRPLAVVITIALLGIFLAAPCLTMADAIAERAAPSTTSRGLAAMDEAAANGKYLFIFFWKQNDKQSQAMHKVFQSAMGKWADSAESVSIPIIDRKEKPVVDQFDISRAPMPLVLALAPNGAITKGFPVKFDEKQLQQAFVSPGTAQCLKAIQDDKLVLLCVQNEQTKFSQAAMSGARSFKADPRYAKASEIVTVDPADPAEATFLQDLKVDPKTTQAVTVLLAPPGQPVATFAGAVSKEQIIAKVKAGPCADGKCGPGGCCPPKK